MIKNICLRINVRVRSFMIYQLIKLIGKHLYFLRILYHLNLFTKYSLISIGVSEIFHTTYK